MLRQVAEKTCDMVKPSPAIACKPVRSQNFMRYRDTESIDHIVQLTHSWINELVGGRGKRVLPANTR
jgi:hypothetical protein